MRAVGPPQKADPSSPFAHAINIYNTFEFRCGVLYHERLLQSQSAEVARGEASDGEAPNASGKDSLLVRQHRTRLIGKVGFLSCDCEYGS